MTMYFLRHDDCCCCPPEFEFVDVSIEPIMSLDEIPADCPYREQLMAAAAVAAPAPSGGAVATPEA
jgi:hypothetical protein